MRCSLDSNKGGSTDAFDKFSLVDCGVGVVAVKLRTFQAASGRNGQVETSPKTQITRIKLDVFKSARHTRTFVYHLLNKLQGVISATEDACHKTVLF